jgi:hypothetical protein
MLGLKSAALLLESLVEQLNLRGRNNRGRNNWLLNLNLLSPFFKSRGWIRRILTGIS